MKTTKTASDKIKLTKIAVDKLPHPASGQVLVWDSDLVGFGIRLTPGSKTYIVQGRVNGKSRRVALGKHGIITADNARKNARDTLAGFDKGLDPVEEGKRITALSVTLREVADAYISDRGDKLRPATVDNINKHVDKSFSTWTKKPVADISRDKVATKHIELSKNSKAQADQAFRVLRSLLNYARARYRPDDAPILLENPVDVLNKGQRGLWNQVKAREIRIPDDKVGIAWNTLQALRDDPAQTTSSRTNADLICILLLTGTRWSEAAGLTWDRVNLEEKWFHLPDPKNRNPVTLPLSAIAIEILKERTRTNQYVFPARNKRNEEGHVKDARGTLAKISAAIGVDVCNHDMRRTFTNIALKKCRIPLVAVKMLTNHKLTGDVTVEHYAEKSDMRFLAPETEQVSKWIEEQGKIAAAGNVISLDARRA